MDFSSFRALELLRNTSFLVRCEGYVYTLSNGLYFVGGQRGLRKAKSPAVHRFPRLFTPSW